MTLRALLLVATALFSVGIYGLVTRRQAVALLLAIEVMANAANLVFVAFARYGGAPGHPLVLVALAIAGVMAYHVWHEVNEEIEPATPEELLASFEQARSEGELDDEEYARVRREIEKTAARPPASKPARRDDQAGTSP